MYQETPEVEYTVKLNYAYWNLKVDTIVSVTCLYIKILLKWGAVATSLKGHEPKSYVTN